MPKPSLLNAVVVASIFALSAVACAQAASSSRWTPLSRTATALTGPLTLSPKTIAFDGKSFAVTTTGKLSGTNLSNASDAIPMSAKPVGAALYRTHIPANATFLGHGSLCSKADVTWIMLVETGPELNIKATLGFAVFSGTMRPDLAPAELANSKHLCGTFTYTSSGVAALP